MLVTTRQLAFATLVMVIAGGCDSGPVRTQKTDSGTSTTVTVEVDKEQIRRDKEAFRVKAEAKLREWDQKLAELQTRAEKAGGETKADLEREIEAQKPKLEAARRELKEIDSMAGEKWAEFQARSSKAWDDISAGFERGFSRFK
jgi:broad specificity phosphatase PhoE